MSRNIFALGMLFIVLNLSGQDYQITFGVIGDSRTPDSVRVDNQDRVTSLNVLGDDIVHLVRFITGIAETDISYNSLKVYPNPFKESANIEFYNPLDGSVNITIADITGKLIEVQEFDLPQGFNSLTLYGLAKGTYVLSIQGLSHNYSALLFSPFSASQQTNTHLSRNFAAADHGDIHPDLEEVDFLKSAMAAEEIVEMEYRDGEQLLFTGFLDSNISEISLSPTSDQIIQFDFSPVSGFYASELSFPVGSLIQFTDTSTNNPVRWDWDFGDGNVSFEQHPGYTYNTVGNYTIGLTVTNKFGPDTETKTDYITVNHPAPLAEFSGTPVEIIVGESVQFTDHSTNYPTTWLWDFGDGNSSTLETPSHIYSIAGTYTVTLTVSNISGSDSEIKTDYITANPQIPIAEFNGTPLESIAGESVQFTDQSTNDPGTWLWDFGDGANSSQQNPSHIYSSAGDYTVTLMVSNITGSDTEVKTDYLNVNPHVPIADFSSTSEVVVLGGSVQFMDESGYDPTTWSWNFGDGRNSTLENPSHTYLSLGTYTVTLTVSNIAGTDSETKVDYISVNPPIPVADFSGTPQVLVQGESVQFTDQSTNNPTTWSWNFGDGGSSTQENPSHVYTSIGTYTVSLNVSNVTGSDLETKSSYITVNSIVQIPVADFSATPLEVTEGESVQFTDLSSNSPTSWTWNFGDGNSSTQQNPSNIYATAGTYTISLISDNTAGSDTEIKSGYIRVIPETAGTISDIDGNTYPIIQIGDQMWMAENLRTTRYSDNTAIPYVDNTAAWDALVETDPAYCWFNNSISTGAVYGASYNWPAAMRGAASSDANPSGVQGVCPAGWHMPSDSEWKELEMFLGMSQAAADGTGFRGTDEGGKLKETGLVHWNTPNTGATNESGFTALPSGFRRSDGSFYGLGIFSDIWTATEATSTTTWRRYLPYNHEDITRDPLSKNYGFSVRCVQD